VTLYAVTRVPGVFYAVADNAALVICWPSGLQTAARHTPVPAPPTDKVRATCRTI
jgi:hypothetical protein